MAGIVIDSARHEITEGTRLVRAIEDAGVDILHRCGGNAMCTTCRVEFQAGEPTSMTEAEHTRLEARGLLGEVRLSCQILCESDMEITVPMRVSTTDMDSAGDTPSDEITPEPVWIDRS